METQILAPKQTLDEYIFDKINQLDPLLLAKWIKEYQNKEDE